jgi:hypothetical protein
MDGLKHCRGCPAVEILDRATRVHASPVDGVEPDEVEGMCRQEAKQLLVFGRCYRGPTLLILFRRRIGARHHYPRPRVTERPVVVAVNS